MYSILYDVHYDALLLYILYIIKEGKKLKIKVEKKNYTCYFTTINFQESREYDKIKTENVDDLITSNNINTSLIYTLSLY